MDYKIERLEMSGNGKRIRWTIEKDGERVFKTEHGFLTWETKKEIKQVLKQLEVKGPAFITEIIQNNY